MVAELAARGAHRARGRSLRAAWGSVL